MSGEDIIVCGVRDNCLVEDIRVMVPKGEAVCIKGLLANKSRDLWRLLSQGLLFRLNANGLLRSVRPAAGRSALPAPIEPDETAQLRETVARLQVERDSLRAEVGSLREKLYRLQVQPLESDSSKEVLKKLENLTELVMSRPTATVTIPSVQPSPPVEDDAPIYIPSQIKSDGSGRVSMKEQKSDGSGLSDVSQKLKGLRKKAKS